MANELVLELRIGNLGIETFRCHALDGNEAINGSYCMSIDGSSHLEPHELAEMVGESARLTLRTPERVRAFHGIIAATACLGSVDVAGHARWKHRIEVRPRLHLTTLRKTSRVFEDCTAASIIREVLEPYGIPVQFRLVDELPVRAYTTQLDETDWQLIERLAADHGLSWFFEQPAPISDDLFEIPGEIGELAKSIGGAVGQAVGGPVGALLGAASTVVLPPRALLVFADRPHHHPLCLPPKPWESLLAPVEALVSGLGAPAIVGQVVGAVEQVVSTAFDLTEAAEATLDFQPASAGLQHGSERIVLTFEVRREVVVTRARFHHYDPWRPQSSLVSNEEERLEDALWQRSLFAPPDPGHLAEAIVDQVVETGLEMVTQALEGEDAEVKDEPLAVFEHHGRSPEPHWRYEAQEARRMLNRGRRRRFVARGTTHFPWLESGHCFVLRGHDVDAYNRIWLVVSVSHQVRPPDAENEAGSLYLAYFEAVPAETRYPPSPAPRRFTQAIATAKVVGEGDIHTNERGQIRVRFHWDRQGRSTCWLRVMQPWAGAGFGAQFLPRVGTEVVVGFEGGDPDMPIVLGGVYNGVHPLPFQLPEEKRRSGFRSRSTPAGTDTNYNELSFDDTGGEERVYLRAQKDYEQEILHDRTVAIAHDDRLQVRNERHVEVAQGSYETYRTERVIDVGRSQRITVEGTRSDVTEGDVQVRVAGAQRITIEGARHDLVKGSRLGSTLGDAVERVGGSHTLVVGGERGDRTAAVSVRGNYVAKATKHVQLQADEGITLRCGDSAIIVTGEKIELSSPKIVLSGEDARVMVGEGKIKLKADSLVQAMAEELVLAGSSSNLAMTSEVSVEGSQILLNSPGNASDPASGDETTPTIIELVDQTGQPIAHHPYRIVLPNGSELGGALDANGRAEIDLDQGGDIIFPGLGRVEAQ